MKHTLSTLFLLCASPILVPIANAAPQHVTLTPSNTQATLHAKSAVADIDGSFEKLGGSVTYNLTDQTCHVDLTMDVNSIKVGSAVLRTVMLSGLMLDGDDHPAMHYVGDCQPTIHNGKVRTQLVGSLTMRGQTRPLTFDVNMVFQKNTLTKIASATTFDQRQWGLSTMLNTVDPHVRTETVITLN